jgi:hypothetical protein
MKSIFLTPLWLILIFFSFTALGQSKNPKAISQNSAGGVSDFQVLLVSADDSFKASEKSLEFASMDANRLARALTQVSKVPESKIINLKNPTLQEFDTVLSELSKTSAQKFMFYYSGHSDENGLNLKDGLINKAKFHDLLAKITSKVKIVVLDSCFSGSLKTKGVTKSKPIELVQYNVDEPTGSVILTSSSGKELSYESDKLKGSIFTYHLVSGLYGQADSNTDGLVTIDELYQYVYAQTKFQSMVSGGKVQSPEFESKLTGQGALVVSYPAKINGQVALAAPVQGELTLTAAKGINFFKFYKNKGEDRTVSVPKGVYEVTVTEADRVGTGTITVNENQTQQLNTENLVWDKRNLPPVRAKGLQNKFLVGVAVAIHPSFYENEEGSTMGELFLMSPASEALKGMWRLTVHIGGETHKVKNTDAKSEYNRMSIGGEGSYNGYNKWNNEWLIGLRIGTFTANNDTVNPSSSSLTHAYIGTRFYPRESSINMDFLLGVDTIRSGSLPSKSVNTFGVALNY